MTWPSEHRIAQICHPHSKTLLSKPIPQVSSTKHFRTASYWAFVTRSDSAGPQTRLRALNPDQRPPQQEPSLWHCAVRRAPARRRTHTLRTLWSKELFALLDIEAICLVRRWLCHPHPRSPASFLILLSRIVRTSSIKATLVRMDMHGTEAAQQHIS